MLLTVNSNWEQSFFYIFVLQLYIMLLSINSNNGFQLFVLRNEKGLREVGVCAMYV